MTDSINFVSTDFEWLTSIPSNWVLRRCKYLFKLITEQAPENNYEELLSVYTDIGVKPRKDLEQRGNRATTTDYYWLVRKQDIIINKLLAWMGAIGVSEYDGVTSPAYDVLRPKINVNPYYYSYLLRNKIIHPELKKYSRGIMEMRLRLYFDELGKIYLPLPPINIQNHIVDFLNKKNSEIDKYISLKQKQIDLLNEQKSAIINQAVTKGLEQNVQLKDSGDKNIGAIPKNWQVRKLKFVSEVIFSNVDKHSFEEELKVLLCNYVDVYKNDFIVLKTDFMEATASKSEIEKFSIKKDDIIITKDSESNEDIAKPSLVLEDFENVVCGYHLAIIRIKSKSIISKYLFYLFNASVFNKQFVIKANGITRYGLSQLSIKDSRVLIPDLKEQEKIVSFIEEKTGFITVQIISIQRQIDLIKEYKNSLIAEAVTGKLKIS